jgi:hypothetical protein
MAIERSSHGLLTCQSLNRSDWKPLEGSSPDTATGGWGVRGGVARGSGPSHKGAVAGVFRAVRSPTHRVIPANAGIHLRAARAALQERWIPAFAGMTVVRLGEQ